MKKSISILASLALIVGLTVGSPSLAQNKPIPLALVMTNAYDAFGSEKMGLRRDFGFSTVVEYRGKTILFDAGTDARVFESNLKTLKIDLRRVDIAIVSHGHYDHTGGFHLIPYKREYIEGLAKRMKEEYEVEFVAPAHCSGHLGFSIFQKVFGYKYRFFGLGEKINL